ncbi:MAG: beta-ketoacyl synthase N-terminal-like domain-containing protein, partial [Elusimicrobia bacterium]|nr:beta-ketoacyl synthase N-terminal-like domain-containing protein [Elusimicrobiota bacterium]
MTHIDPFEPIAIIGLGGVFPKALDINAFWENVKARKDCIIEVPKDRWDWHLYYDPNPASPDKTYSKIGGFIEGFKFDPLKLRIPPPVAQQMDTIQQMAVTATGEALKDSGYDKKPFNQERTAVILGNAMGGVKKEHSDTRVYSAFFLDHLKHSASFAKLPAAAREAIAAETEKSAKSVLTTITEDTMPGELSNVIAGRVANAFNFNGANLTVDAACASALAAVAQAVHGLRLREYDMVFSGGVDQMMSPPAYVKFCKIGALSPDGSRPFDADANGFVMGEGTGIFALKRLSDALKDGDRIYALIRSIGSSSDGKGKGITAPNPKGQKFAIERCFEGLEYGPDGVDLLEAHGTSTKVGDVVEVTAAAEIFGRSAKKGSIGLGSVKSQVGHLKAAAGAVALAKVALALRHKILPPSINFKKPNPGIDWANSPFRVLTECEEWKRSGHPRRANISAFGFGGTNFHIALEEAEPDTVDRIPAWHMVKGMPESARGGDGTSLPAREAGEGGASGSLPPSIVNMEPGMGGEAFFIHASTPQAAFDNLKALADKQLSGPLTTPAYAFDKASKRSEYSLCIAAENAAKLKEKAEFVLKTRDAVIFDRALPHYRTKSIYGGHKRKPGKIGFMFPGQGSQYVDMMKDLRDKYQVVADTFEEADRIMQGFIGEKLSDILFTKGGETPERIAQMEERIKQTEITQPAVLTAGVAVMRLLETYGIKPDVVIGHSLGEYGALVGSGIVTFSDALLAVSARAKEMASVNVPDHGKMASISGPLAKVEPVLKTIDGYVAIANKNCPIQTVIAGESKAIDAAIAKFSSLGIQAVEVRVSHAFHSKIVAPAQESYGRFFDRIPVKKASVPILSNVTADYYPETPAEIRKLLVRQIAEPVEFIRQVERMYADGVRIFIEVGPKRVLTAFATSILEGKPDAVTLSSNHPKRGGILELNDLLARVTAEGMDLNLEGKDPAKPGFYTARYRAWLDSSAKPAGASVAAAGPAITSPQPSGGRSLPSGFEYNTGPVVISGLGAGVPGTWDRLFRENGLDQIIHGQNLIEALPEEELYKQLDKNLDRVKKSETGAHSIERMESVDQVLRLAGRAGTFDIAEEFGVRASVNSLMDITAKMGLAATLLALKDAGVPLVHHYKRTTTGSMIPTSWGLPEALQSETGVILASAFPASDSLISELTSYFRSKYGGKVSKAAWVIYDRLMQSVKDPADRQALTDWYVRQRAELEKGGPVEEYKFSRSFLFRALTLGHGQVAQFIRAKGPVTQVNAACASTTQAVGIAEDWIRTGRCKRVVVMGADDITNPVMLEWFGTGFLASGAANTGNVVSEAALPFDRRRNGMIVGMGAVGLVVEEGALTAARGMKPLAELLATQFENAAFHVTRLDTGHVSATMERLMQKAERRHGVSRKQIAQKMLFMSHETYTPAQGGSSAAEVTALKHVFKEDTSKVIVTNTKGFTGHSMGASIEDAVAVRAMNLGKVPPIANYKEPDPELAGITLSKGGAYDVEYALRLAAGFGSQIAMTLTRRAWKVGEPRVFDPGRHQGWLRQISGEQSPELEVVNNTLRVKDTGSARARPPERVAAPATRPAPVAVPVAAAAPVVQPAAPAPVTAASSGRDESAVTKEVIALVSEKTGYPAEMLELDLDMEADLGIDTVKQAELIGIIREKYGIPKQENLSLKEYPTLRHVIRFVMGGASPAARTTAAAAPAGGTAAPAPAAVRPAEVRPQVPAPVQAAAAPVAAAAPTAANGASGSMDAQLTQQVVALVSEKTGYPAEMLELDLDMEADLGIDTVKQAELIGIIRERYS